MLNNCWNYVFLSDKYKLRIAPVNVVCTSQRNVMTLVTSYHSGGRVKNGQKGLPARGAGRSSGHRLT